jgi:hypothetical protein
MDSERTSVTGTVVFRFNYKLTGAEVRPCQYGQAKYQPTLLSFSATATTYDGTPPSYDDLRAGDASLWGYKIKKNGEPGLAETKETFWYGHYPVWIDRVIEAALLELREGV